MKAARGRWTKQHQVCLDDTEAWVQQLEEEHGTQVRWSVYFPTARHGIRPSVTLTCYLPRANGREEPRWFGWENVPGNEVGAVEACMLRLVSKALLELESDRERAERQQTLL